MKDDEETNTELFPNPCKVAGHVWVPTGLEEYECQDCPATLTGMLYDRSR